MKALSLKQPWASMIASGEKTIETRRWYTSFRGDLLICSSKSPADQGPAGVMLCVVDLYSCLPLAIDDLGMWAEACCEPYEGAFGWCVRNVRPVEHLPVRGQLGLFEVPNDLVRCAVELDAAGRQVQRVRGICAQWFGGAE